MHFRWLLPSRWHLLRLVCIPHFVLCELVVSWHPETLRIAGLVVFLKRPEVLVGMVLIRFDRLGVPEHLVALRLLQPFVIQQSLISRGYLLKVNLDIVLWIVFIHLFARIRLHNIGCLMSLECLISPNRVFVLLRLPAHSLVHLIISATHASLLHLKLEFTW